MGVAIPQNLVHYLCHYPLHHYHHNYHNFHHHHHHHLHFHPSMGYDTEQFEGPIAEELICVICTGVLADPVTTHCDHLFCAACINDWLRQNRTCPIDRGPLRACMLRPPARALRNLINRLPIHCDFRAEGCPEVLPLEAYTAHLAGCVHNPARLVRCRYYCKRTMTAKAMRTHNCVSRLIELTAALEETNRRLANERQMLLYVVALLVFFPPPARVSPPAGLLRWALL
ncbi:E3 ubiquitin-protein ligase NRDP1 [Tyrophagus putrescentiae]|nr:E3 ubiquitin-protein ligase NRDP1 [Tyrophagus putrescentiae]